MSGIDSLLEEKAKIIDEVIEKYIPRKFKKNSAVFKVNLPRFSYNLEALNEAIAKPIWEFLDRGGKRWRPAMFLLICEALGKNPKDFLDYVTIPEVVHNGTLLVDDLEDSSESRRGKPCTYLVFGVDIAVNAGNAMYYLPLLPLMMNEEKLHPKDLSKLYRVYSEEMINLHFGQAMDIAWHKGLANADEIDEKDYLQMCAYKTGTLARMAAKLAAILAGADSGSIDKLGHFAETIGVAFQIQDDILDLTSSEFAKGKGGRGMDITEGKRTLMVIHTLRKAQLPDRKRLIAILDMHTDKQELRDEAIRILEKYRAIQYAKRYAKNMVKQSWNEISGLLKPSDAKNKLQMFVQYLVERST
ncbi:polyprenyl synthetase family protein [Candidatus Bathyarchaeota archaeon]|nr:polyprenyl synthetase family protein [Candidatus Bathyarchaeota archaeon]